MNQTRMSMIATKNMTRRDKHKKRKKPDYGYTDTSTNDSGNCIEQFADCSFFCRTIATARIFTGNIVYIFNTTAIPINSNSSNDLGEGNFYWFILPSASNSPLASCSDEFLDAAGCGDLELVD
ncbi:LOW QUALITY PROTEIN: hypothetical protein ColTof3_14349 [Colletotrichum tofieldiae]|nr:LOW QUALITY PROTEIN: hypothetical protein ColTof3_14349 [Colletotrichum tofieldiae]GKT94739.1 LOW QUALITY PROTEIN: hypothetical protein Ct61P_12589 [Colletotrichum tofieldiae]